MSDALSRAQRRIISAVMASIERDGFVIAGGAALLAAGVSDRPTEDLDAFSASCRDLTPVVDRLVAELVSGGLVVDVRRGADSFAQMTVMTGRWRRTALRVELGRDSQMFEAVASPLGPMLSLRELAANKVLAAFGRHEPRDLVDMAALARVVSLRQAFTDACVKDGGFDAEVFTEMVTRTLEVRDDLWPAGSDPAAVREFIDREALGLAAELGAAVAQPPGPAGASDPDRSTSSEPIDDVDRPSPAS